MVCRCNKEAKASGYKFFAIRFYGICVGFHSVDNHSNYGEGKIKRQNVLIQNMNHAT